MGAIIAAALTLAGNLIQKAFEYATATEERRQQLLQEVEADWQAFKSVFSTLDQTAAAENADVDAEIAKLPTTSAGK